MPDRGSLNLMGKQIKRADVKVISMEEGKKSRGDYLEMMCK